jgi:predicted transcriptional regulator
LARISGVHYVSLARLEAGLLDPRLSTLRKLSKALKVTITELVGERKHQKKGGR